MNSICIIAQVLSNSDVNSKNEERLAHILLQYCDDYSY